MVRRMRRKSSDCTQISYLFGSLTFSEDRCSFRTRPLTLGRWLAAFCSCPPMYIFGKHVAVWSRARPKITQANLPLSPRRHTTRLWAIFHLPARQNTWMMQWETLFSSKCPKLQMYAEQAFMLMPYIEALNYVNFRTVVCIECNTGKRLSQRLTLYNIICASVFYVGST